jgi:hypothetical protein
MGMARRPSHGQLIREVWPDKALFGAVILFITGLLGLLFTSIEATIDVELSARVPTFLREYPPLVTVACSLLTFIFAGVSLRNRDTGWALWGCLAGVAAFGLLGVGTALSLVALLFLLKSRHEREDFKPETLRLTSDQWPDKSLAASLLLLMAGIVAIVWGVLLLLELVNLEIGRTAILGAGALISGLVSFLASAQLYVQRGFWVGTLASIGAVGSIGFYVIGPLLGIGAFVLLFLAHREREFDRTHPTTAPQ